MPRRLTDQDLLLLRELLQSSQHNHTTLMLPELDRIGFADLELGQNITYEDLVRIVNETRHDETWLPLQTEVYLILAYVIVICLGLFSNSLICYVVLKRKTLRTVRNMFILNLAVSDIVMCLFCMPFTLIKLLSKNWMFGDFMCRLIPWLQSTNVFASTITITAIALDRYHVILYPCINASRIKVCGAVVLIIAIWCSASIIGIPLILYSKTVTETYFVLISFHYCIEIWPSTASKITYAAIVMVFQFLAPIIVLFAVHWRISAFLKLRINRNPTTKTELQRAMKEARRHRKNTTLLMAIAVMYALCWFPLTILNFLADFNYKYFMHEDFLLAFATAHLIAMTSATANPIMYGWFNTNFQMEFTKTVCFWKINKKGSSPPDVSPPERDVLTERDRLVKSCPSRIMYHQPISYKAIQTEIQPPIAFQHHLKAPRFKSPALSTEEVQVQTDPWPMQN